MADEATAQPVPDDIAAMSFEEALAALEAIVKTLESGDGTRYGRPRTRDHR